MIKMKTSFFTMIELMAVIAIVMIMVGISVPTLKKLFSTRSVDSSAVVLRGRLSSCRVEAIQKGCVVGLFIPTTYNGDFEEVLPNFSFRKCYIYNNDTGGDTSTTGVWTFRERANLGENSRFDVVTPWESLQKGTVLAFESTSESSGSGWQAYSFPSTGGLIWTDGKIRNIKNNSTSSNTVKDASGESAGVNRLNTVTINGMSGFIIAFLPSGKSAYTSSGTGSDVAPARIALRLASGFMFEDEFKQENEEDFVSLIIDQTGGSIRVIGRD